MSGYIVPCHGGALYTFESVRRDGRQVPSLVSWAAGADSRKTVPLRFADRLARKAILGTSQSLGGVDRSDFVGGDLYSYITGKAIVATNPITGRSRVVADLAVDDPDRIEPAVAAVDGRTTIVLDQRRGRITEYSTTDGTVLSTTDAPLVKELGEDDGLWYADIVKLR